MHDLLLIGYEYSSNPRFVSALQALGCEVTIAEINGEYWDGFNPANADAVVLYLSGARGDAFRLMYRIRRSIPRVPIVAIAPFYDSELERHARRSGASFVVAEPVDSDDLAEFVAGCCGLSCVSQAVI